MHALDARAVREYPGRKSLDACLRADRRNRLGALDPALNIGSVLKGRAKFLLLLLAMRTPKRAVHFGLLCRQAPGKSVQTSVVPVPSEIVRGRKHHYDRDGNAQITQSHRVWRFSPLPLLLPFSTLL